MQIKLSYLIAPVICWALQSCVSNSNSVPPPPLKKAEPAAKIYKPTKEWPIRSTTDLRPLTKLGAKVKKKGDVVYVNLNGIVIDGIKQKGDGGQGERQTPLFRAYIPLFVENGFFTNIKNAATFYKPNSGLKNVTLTKIGEDGVATGDGAKNFRLENCEFSGAADKSIQLNEADGAIIVGNTVVGGVTGARIGKIDYSSSKDVASCAGNTFVNVDTAWNVGKISLVVKKDDPNTYKNVRLPFKTASGAKIKNADGKISQ